MFTGLVQDLGTVAAVGAGAGGVRLAVRTGLAGEIAEGDSVAVNGVCLTATRIADGHFSADVMHETLRRSSLAGVEEGTAVNLELPLRAEDRLGGHFVQGHVDGLGTVRSIEPDGFAKVVSIAGEDSGTILSTRCLDHLRAPHGISRRNGGRGRPAPRPPLG